MTLRKEARKVREAARIYGGSFINALATATLYADDQNLQKIKETWREE